MLPPPRHDPPSSSQHLSPSVFDLTPEPDFASLSDYSDPTDDLFMSGEPFQFQDPLYWAQQVPTHFGPTHLYSAHPDNSGNSFDFRQHTGSIPSRDWHLYADGSFGQSFTGQPNLSPQTKLGQHRRALSTSTAASASTSSPRQYPAAYDSSTYLDPNTYAAYQGNHYPTPTQTPTQDSFMEHANPRQNRISAAQRAMKNAAANDQPQQQNLSAAQPAQYYPIEYPATPATSIGDFSERQQQQANRASFGEIDLANSSAWAYSDSLLFDEPLAMRQIPNLSRTMSDIYQDELYNPSNAPSQPQQVGSSASLLSPHRAVMNNLLQAANEARSSHSPVDLKRETSPFRANSPFAPASHGFGPVQGGTAAGQRQQQKAEADARAFQQHHMQPENAAPKTMSPQEAYLDRFHDPAEDSVTGPSLFPQNASSSQPQLYESNGSRLIYGPLGDPRELPTSTFNFNSPAAPATSQAPTSAGYRFSSSMAHRSNDDSNEDAPSDFPAHLISMETSKSEADLESSQEADVERPIDTTADGGTYTCTYQNCTRRFATPALLQKHKREGHRSVGGPSVKAEPGSPTDRATASASPSRNTQAGPHKCDRINPSTGKPCNTIFSRPYDLTRHEDTIHARRGKIQCQYCTEEKTFSRADALTRHMRVVHPTIDFPGKHRRRHVD